MEKIKNCPFCGGVAELVEAMGEKWVICGACKISGGTTTEWNKRACDYIHEENTLLKQQLTEAKEVIKTVAESECAEDVAQKNAGSGMLITAGASCIALNGYVRSFYRKSRRKKDELS